MKFKKKLILINRDFQVRFMKSAVVVGITSTLLTVVFILYPLAQFELIREITLPWPILLAMILAAFLNICLVAVFAIYLTHRIAGPMYSLVKHMRLITLGEWSNEKIQIREKDELRYIIRNFNELKEYLEKSVCLDLEKLQKIIDSLETLQTGASEISRESESKALKDLIAFQHRLQKRITDSSR